LTCGARATQDSAMLRVVIAIFALGCAVGCKRSGFATPEQLEARNQGASGCAARCAADGMRMAGMVHIGTRSACVCEVVGATSGGQVLMPAAASAVEIVLADEEDDEEAAAGRER